MKTVQINKVKVNIFEEDDLKEKLGFRNEQIMLIVEHQRKFPELLQNDIDGYCIDARNLHSKLVKNVKVNKDGESKKGDLFSQWISRRIKKYGFIENRDFINIHKFVNRENTNLKSKITEYNITLDMAKQLCMLENNEVGQNARMYFIYMEQALRNMKIWESTRIPEKQEYNIMVDELRKWCEINNYDTDEKTFKRFRVKESNMINENLTGKIASEIKIHIGYEDNITRDHLPTEVNEAIYQLQLLNTNLLVANMSFSERSDIIKSICNTKYDYLKEKYFR